MTYIQTVILWSLLCCLIAPWATSVGAYTNLLLIRPPKLYRPTDKELPPEERTSWITNNTANWPQIGYEDIIDYLLKSNSFDSKEMKAFRATYAYNYVQNGWLGNIESCVDNEVHFLKACVTPSQPGVSSIAYNAWIASQKDGVVLSGSCTCPAGLGRSCSHVAAIMYAVHLAWLHGYAGKSCTDLPCKWGRGTESHTLLNELKAMNFKHPNRTDDPCKADGCSVPNKSKPYRFKQFASSETFVEHINSSPLLPLWTLKGTLLHKTFSSAEHLQLGTDFDHVDVDSVDSTCIHDSHDLDYSKTVTKLHCSVCQEFYDKYVNLSESKCKELSTLTLNQSASTNFLWKDSRRVRITASKANSVPKTRRGDPEKFLNNLLYERFKGNENTAYGVINEPTARTEYEDISGNNVLLSGTVICPHEPYLSASPDGFVGDSGILEIKCPTTSVKTVIDTGKGDVRNIDGQLVLYSKGRNGYYTQVQLCMFCTGKKKCDFYMWRPDNDTALLDIQYDSKFVETTVLRLRSFYFQHMLVRLVDDFKAGRFVLSDEYQKFCS